MGRRLFSSALYRELDSHWSNPRSTCQLLIIVYYLFVNERTSGPRVGETKHNQLEKWKKRRNENHHR